MRTKLHKRGNAIRDHLLPFKEALEKRATQQEWFELQQAQVAYQERLGETKISWPHFQNSRAFACDSDGLFINNKCFFLPLTDNCLLAFLNSKLCWWQLFAQARIKRGNYIEAEAQYIEKLIVPSFSSETSKMLSRLAEQSTANSQAQFAMISQTRNRIATDLGAGAALSRKLEHWHELDFTAFLAEVKRLFKTTVPPKERNMWEAYLKEEAAKVKTLSAQIVTAEAEINRLVYDAFELSSEEILLLETSIQGQI